MPGVSIGQADAANFPRALQCCQNFPVLLKLVGRPMQKVQIDVARSQLFQVLLKLSPQCLRLDARIAQGGDMMGFDLCTMAVHPLETTKSSDRLTPELRIASATCFALLYITAVSISRYPARSAERMAAALRVAVPYP